MNLNMIDIKEFYKVSNFAPVQWIGRTRNNDSIYIRYRNNRIQIIRGNPPLKSHPESTVVLSIEHTNDQGKLSTRTLLDLLSESDININIKDEKTYCSDQLESVLLNMRNYVNNKDIN